jgi:hypothetical protein
MKLSHFKPDEIEYTISEGETAGPVSFEFVGSVTNAGNCSDSRSDGSTGVDTTSLLLRMVSDTTFEAKSGLHTCCVRLYVTLGKPNAPRETSFKPPQVSFLIFCCSKKVFSALLVSMSILVNGRGFEESVWTGLPVVIGKLLTQLSCTGTLICSFLGVSPLDGPVVEVG